MRAAAELRKQIESALAGRIPAALSPRPLRSPELVSCGIPAVDALLGGGLPLGAIVEFTGARSAGRTTVALSTLAELTGQGHCCAYVDGCDVLDPLSAAALGVRLERLLWIRPKQTAAAPRRAVRSKQPSRTHPAQRLEAALRATDLLLNAGGFRAIVLDIADVPPEQAQRTPMATWYRFRLQAEKSQILLLLITPAIRTLAKEAANQPTRFADGGAAEASFASCAQNCAAVSLYCEAASPEWRQAAAQSPRLLTALDFRFAAKDKGGSMAKKTTASGAANRTGAWRGAMSWTG